MTNPRRVLTAAAVTAAVLASGYGAWTYAQSCDQSAAFRLYAGSYMDSMLNPPKAEDVEFFTQSSGVPNIMILLDNSGSMRRLPPNGPGFLGGTAPPSGTERRGLWGDPHRNRARCCRRWRIASTPPPAGPLSPRESSARPSIPARDYAMEASVCPKWSNAGKTTGNPGYDPDWYCSSDSSGTATTCNGHVNLFPKNLVFHDVIVDDVDTGHPRRLDGYVPQSLQGEQQERPRSPSSARICRRRGRSPTPPSATPA